MRIIQASITTHIPSTKIWNIWKESKPWNHFGESKCDLEENAKGYVASKHGRRVSYHITQVKEQESFTILWKALFVKLFFTYEVLPKGNLSLITYKVHLRGFFSLIVYYLIKNKIRKNLQTSLQDFVRKIEN